MKQTKAGVSFVLPFGKYKGKTLGKIIIKDPAYIMWLIDGNVLKQGVTNEVFEAAYVEGLEKDDNYNDDSFPNYEDL